MGRLGYVPALDGLRGIAISIVVAFHVFGLPFGGWLGVDLFLVLSGFLITTLLLEEHAATGTIRVRAFYVRRVRRLGPALAVLLAGYLAIGAMRGVDGLGPVARFGLYTGNFTAAFWPADRFRSGGLIHLWSLAQEEQFYLLWPVALLLVRRARNPVVVLALLAAALIVYRDALVAAGASAGRVYYGPDTHLEGLVLGAALAFRLRERPFVVGRRLLAVAAALAALLVLPIPQAAAMVAFFLPLFEVAALVLVAAAVSGTLRLPRALIWVGGISYSLYLWHFVILWAFDWQHQLLAVPISVAVAYASTRWIERPFRRRRATAAAPRPVLVPVAS